MENTKSLIENTGANARTVLSDLQHLNRVGFWPNNEVPKWALKLSQVWSCSAAGGAVTSNGWQYVAETLATEIGI